jgi:hypothetical protein
MTTHFALFTEEDGDVCVMATRVESGTSALAAGATCARSLASSDTVLLRAAKEAK